MFEPVAATGGKPLLLLKVDNLGVFSAGDYFPCCIAEDLVKFSPEWPNDFLETHLLARG